MNLTEEREQLIFEALCTLMETPSIPIPQFSEKLGIDKEKLYSIFEILYSENYARNLTFARGGRGNKIQIAWYDTAIITDKGIRFMKEYMKAHSNRKESLYPCGMLTVFISYNWNDSAFVDDIDASLVGKAEVHRDKDGIKPWGSITDFMKSIRQQDFAVLVISDAYLRSSACLYEVVQLMKDDGWNEKTMYVVLDDAMRIYDALSQADYIKYWNEKCESLKKKITGLPPAATAKLSEELNKSNTILLRIGDFMSMVADANNPPLDKVIAEIQKRVLANLNSPAPNGTVTLSLSTAIPNSPDMYFIMNVPRTLSKRNRLYDGNTFIWWHIDNKGYTDDLRYAKAFTLEEVNEKIIDNYNWGCRKFAAIPADIVANLGQTVVPITNGFLSTIKSEPNRIIGNKNIYLEEDEIYELG